MFPFIRQQTAEVSPKTIVAAYNRFVSNYPALIEAADNAWDIDGGTISYRNGLLHTTITRAYFPIARYIATIQSNYVLGNPPEYEFAGDAESAAGSGNADLQNILRYYRRQSKQRLDKKLAKECAKYGFAYELAYYDDNLDPKSLQLPTASTFVVFDYSTENNSVFAVTWAMIEEGAYTVSVYSDAEIIRYSASSLAQANSYRETERMPHHMGRVPVTMWLNNEDGESGYASVLPLIQTLIDAVTDEKYDIRRTVDAILVFYNTKLAGASLEEKQKIFQTLRALGFLELNDDESTPENKSDVKTLSNPLNLTAVDAFVDRIWTAIFALSGVPDPTRTEYYTSISGVALKMQMFIGLEPHAKDSEGEFEFALKRRLKMYTEFLRVVGKGAALDAGDIEIRFKHTMPSNDLEIAQMVSILAGTGTVSKQTLAAQIPFVSDPQAEVVSARGESSATNDLMTQLALSAGGGS